MKEQVLIQIYNKDGEYITSQDVSGFRPDQVDEIIRIKKEEYGLECRVKRVFNDGEV